jgi:hypothetical protein
MASVLPQYQNTGNGNLSIMASESNEKLLDIQHIRYIYVNTKYKSTIVSKRMLLLKTNEPYVPDDYHLRKAKSQ